MRTSGRHSRFFNAPLSTATSIAPSQGNDALQHCARLPLALWRALFPSWRRGTTCLVLLRGYYPPSGLLSSLTLHRERIMHHNDVLQSLLSGEGARLRAGHAHADADAGVRMATRCPPSRSVFVVLLCASLNVAAAAEASLNCQGRPLGLADSFILRLWAASTGRPHTPVHWTNICVPADYARTLPHHICVAFAGV